MTPLKLGIFFSHPTQHHSAWFQHLSRIENLNVKVYYYDAGSLGGMFDPGYGITQAWDVDLMEGTQSVVLPNLLRGNQINQFRQLNPAIVPIALREKFDAILVSGYVSPSNWLALLGARLTGARVFYQADTNIQDVKRKKSSPLMNRLRRAFFRRVSVFLTIGDNNKKVYKKFGIRESQMVWCPIPVDRPRYEAARTDAQLQSKLEALREQYQIPPDAQIVAFCGKLIARKRPQDIIEALRALNRANVYGLLIGSGELETELKNSLTPEDRIVITGFVNQSQIPYHMLLGDVGVVSSEWDPHPLVTTEFAMCGLPVIVSHFCGVWGEHDILRPDENGFVYPCGDVQALATEIGRLLDDEELRQRMGSRSLEVAVEQSTEYAANVVAQAMSKS